MTIVTVTLLATLVGFSNLPTLQVVESLPAEIAHLSIAAGVLAVLAWNAGIGILGAANGVLFISLVPITAFAIGVAQGHRFGAGEFIGVVLVIGACWPTILRRARPRARS